MVLFKRKPVRFLPPAEVQDDNAEVWHIPQTGEIFTSYEEYLNRMDFYKQRRFNDQITGHSGLTFFEAFKSELAGGREVEASFPDSLKGPILHKVQFQTISRLDNLVDMIFEEFKHEYFPGEEVTVTLTGGERSHALVRDKTTFGPRNLPDGTQSGPLTRYLVEIKDSYKEAIVTNEHMCRERGVFTKAMLRSFIKKTVYREAWNGAPWRVKQEYGSQFKIEMKVPTHLQHTTKIQERKQLQAQKRASLPHEINGHNSAIHSGPVRLPELKPAPKSKAKPVQPESGAKGLKWPMLMPVHGGNPFSYPSNDQNLAPPREPTPPPPPPPPPKYPIEDLQLEPREDRRRPPLKFLCHDPPVQVENGYVAHNNIDMSSVGPLLETWDTLNVYCEVFKLDSFTFDDFVEAMRVASEQVPVQLFDEIHCSVLKILVDSEADGGKVRITLPEIEEEESDEDEDGEEGETAEPTPEPEPKPVGRATRSSLARLEAERLAAELAAAEKESEAAEAEAHHRAEELLKEYDWIEHLRKRDFTNGGWERIIVGLLHQLSKDERQKEDCEELLHRLVPADVEPTQETVRQAYSELDVNYRVKALQIICMLTIETKTIRGYMEECSETMTQYRKEKIDWQRQRKQALEDLRQLNEKRKILLPDNLPPSPPPLQKAEEDVKMTDAEDSLLMSKEEDGEETEEDNAPRNKRRKAQLVAKQRKREEQAKKEKEKKDKTPKPSGQSKQFIKLLKDIQKKEDQIKKCEDEIAILDNDLREADCPRTRVLGKDRFWNRYYWFERNGMPYGGLPNSSTASAGYANGCIWVQGPDDIEREGYIDLPPDLQDEYKAKFNMTVPERKAMEEGRTSVYNAHQWGYISEPVHVDELIRWLDQRGLNELKLRKELLTFKDRIAKHMQNRNDYLAAAEEPEKKEETKRTSSRIRDKTPEPPNYKCLRWENLTALDEVGHLHSDPPPPPRSRKPTKKREATIEAVGPVAKTRKRRG